MTPSSSPRLLCIGHRGAMGHAPENTLSSIKAALALGVRHLEVDVYCVEGELLVFHDDRLERTTNGKGRICDHSFDHLRSLDAGDGQQIPTLQEVCAEIAGRACLNVELKGAGTARPVAHLINQLIACGWQYDCFLVSSFDHRQLVEMRCMEPRIKLGGLLCGLPVKDAEFAEQFGAFSVHPAVDFLDQRFVEDAHRRGLKVYAYTANHPDEIDEAAAMGVDGVFTNYPERVLNQYSTPCDQPAWL